MSDAIKKRTNTALWLGLLITVFAVLSNLLYFSKVPAAALPWLNLTLPAIGLIFLLIGVVRAFGQSQIYRGKVWGSIAAGLAALFLAASAWFFVQVRNIPRSVGAPQVGQRVPDFTLPDSNGRPVALAQLFTASPGMPQPKAVLLVFYRGYWSTVLQPRVARHSRKSFGVCLSGHPSGRDQRGCSRCLRASSREARVHVHFSKRSKYGSDSPLRFIA